MKKLLALILCALMLLPAFSACEKAPLTADEFAQSYISGIDAQAASILATPTTVTSASARLVRSGEGENWAEPGSVDIVDGVATVTFKAQIITTAIEQ